MALDRFENRPDDWPRSFYLPAEHGTLHRMSWNRSQEQYSCTCGHTLEEPPEDPATDREAVLPDRPQAVTTRSGLWDARDTPEWFSDWKRHLPSTSTLDGYRVVDEGRFRVGWADPDPDPLPRPPLEVHRTGTCFENESEEMRAACVDAIGELLGADDVLHEVRHQKSGYHTDLVYADVDPQGVFERAQIVHETEPIHDPLQRFRVWWHLYEHGPKTRAEAIENGRYADASKNEKHLDWLLEHGYVAETRTASLSAVRPPSICELHAVELKLRDWQTALDQASRARRCDLDDILADAFPERRKDRYGYADYAWVALDAGVIHRALDSEERFREEGVGMLAITEGGSVVKHVDAEHQPRGRYTRDRAYAESQVWEEISLDDWLPLEERGDLTGQTTLGAAANRGEKLVE